ncbi:hypothetical protein BHE74_00040992 [Ensete ventricosum]|nr:hypothetical protein GW17_00052162 [Ensete ventricosum]RWW52573.1 hypothetical protein BHE74_00040992 [Ensete ventricosum]
MLSSPWLFTPVDASVSYDRKALIINGRRRILISGSIHYPRSTPEVRNPHHPPPRPARGNVASWCLSLLAFHCFIAQSSDFYPPDRLQMWPDLIQKAKDGGLDVIQTYVFWNVHEPSPGQIENEYGPLEEYYGGSVAKNYASWAAHMAVGLNTGVPWVMCKQDDAPDPVVTIKMCEPALVSADPTVTKLGNYEQAHVFRSKSGACAAFLSNYNPKSSARVTYNGKKYDIPPWSISILPDCKTAVFNTARAFFNAPAGNEPLALDMSSMGKGEAWVNGQSIGRYWPAFKAYGSCGGCDYHGTYNEKKCQTNCGESSQKW